MQDEGQKTESQRGNQLNSHNAGCVCGLSARGMRVEMGHMQTMAAGETIRKVVCKTVKEP